MPGRIDQTDGRRELRLVARLGRRNCTGLESLLFHCPQQRIEKAALTGADHTRIADKDPGPRGLVFPEHLSTFGPGHRRYISLIL